MSQGNLRQTAYSQSFTPVRNKQKLPSLGNFYPMNFTLIPNYDHKYSESLMGTHGIGFNSKMYTDGFKTGKSSGDVQSTAASLSQFFNTSKKEANLSTKNLVDFQNRISSINHSNQVLKTRTKILERKNENILKAKQTVQQMKVSMQDHKFSEQDRMEQKKLEVQMKRRQQQEALQRRKMLQQIQSEAESKYNKMQKEKLKQDLQNKLDEFSFRNKMSVYKIQQEDSDKRDRLIQLQLQKQQQFTQTYQDRIKNENQRAQEKQKKINQLKQDEQQALDQLMQQNDKYLELQDEYLQNLSNNLGDKLRQTIYSTQQDNKSGVFQKSSIQQKFINSYNVKIDDNY